MYSDKQSLAMLIHGSFRFIINTMDNTVGSRGIKRMTTRQRAIVVGKILGDGTLEKNGNYSRLRVCQSDKQKDYVYWLYEE